MKVNRKPSSNPSNMLNPKLDVGSVPVNVSVIVNVLADIMKLYYASIHNALLFHWLQVVNTMLVKD